jgi:hypothetical protein
MPETCESTARGTSVLRWTTRRKGGSWTPGGQAQRRWPSPLPEASIGPMTNRLYVLDERGHGSDVHLVYVYVPSRL